MENSKLSETRHATQDGTQHLNLAPVLPHYTPGAHIPALDGVRGFAVLLVMLHHFALYGGIEPGGWFDTFVVRLVDAGWLGVDLFFVLSGFLITGILLDTKQEQRYFRNFYVRRILRILPLYYVFLYIFFLLYPWLFADDHSYTGLSEEQIWYWAHLANIRFALYGWPEYEGIGHLWSLAVEEQFYLVWPLIVYWLSRRRLAYLCLAIFAGSVLLRITLAVYDQGLAAYVLTPARMDALAIGGLLAILVRSTEGNHLLVRWILPVAGGSSILLLGNFVRKQRFSSTDASVYTLGFTLIALMCAGFVVMSLMAPSQSKRGRFWRYPFLRFLGRYSYALYVFHHPVARLLPALGFSVYSFPSVSGSQMLGFVGFSLVAFAVSLSLALISWHLLESPILSLKRYVRYERDMNRTELSQVHQYESVS